jgi:hypothetical protein
MVTTRGVVLSIYKPERHAEVISSGMRKSVKARRGGVSQQ